MKIRARARELASGGYLAMVVRRHAAGKPVGYCAEHAAEPHATASEATACWRKYLVERTLQLGVTRGDPGPCKRCGTETTGTVVINGYPRDHWCPGCGTAENITAWWNAATEAQAPPVVTRIPLRLIVKPGPGEDDSEPSGASPAPGDMWHDGEQWNVVLPDGRTWNSGTVPAAAPRWTVTGLPPALTVSPGIEHDPVTPWRGHILDGYLVEIS